jgi:hypothetical protein
VIAFERFSEHPVFTGSSVMTDACTNNGVGNFSYVIDVYFSP